MVYEEFKCLKEIIDENNKFSSLYEYEDGSRFYIEPLFYTYLKNFEIQYPNEKQKLLDKMEELTHKNKNVIFTGMDEEYESEPLTHNDNCIVLTFFDVTNIVGILLEDKSRGSDYGD